MTKVKAISRIRVNKKIYNPGDEVDIPDKYILRALEKGAIVLGKASETKEESPPEKPEVSPASKMKSK